MKKIKKNQKASYNGILCSIEEIEKLKRDSLLLDEIEEIIRKQNSIFLISKNT